MRSYYIKMYVSIVFPIARVPAIIPLRATVGTRVWLHQDTTFCVFTDVLCSYFAVIYLHTE